MSPAYFKEHYGDLASVIGLVLTLVGFAVTIWNVMRAKRAAEEARQAAREAVARIGVQLLANEIGTLLQLVREVDAACRGRKWAEVLRQGDEARSYLARLQDHGHLRDEEREMIRQANGTIGELLRYVDALRKKTPPKDISQQKSKSLHEIITLLGGIQGRLQSETLEGRYDR